MEIGAVLLLGIFMAMFGAGLLLGFVGAGGSGFIISILTTLFGFSIHTALGTALSAMIFSSVSGTISHYREGNIVLRDGLAIGIFGACGAWLCSQISVGIEAGLLKYLTAAILYLSSAMLWLRMYIVRQQKLAAEKEQLVQSPERSLEMSMGRHETAAASEGNSVPWIKVGTIGLVCGALSGLFGVGATPFIQISLMAIMGMKVTEAAGTTMLVIVPIAIAGGAGFYGTGNLDLKLLAIVLVSITVGSYIGAKFTRRLPSAVLKTAMVSIPLLGATLLLF